MDEFRYFSFTYKHMNHSVFRGKIKCTSLVNRDTQMLSLLSQRYRRNLPLEGRHGKVIFEELFCE